MKGNGHRGPKRLAGAAQTNHNVMTVREAAEYLHCHTSTLYRLVERGKIPAFKLGGNWRLLLGELERWMSKRTRRIS